MATKKTSTVQKKAEMNTLLGGIDVTPYKQKRGEAYMSETMRSHFREILSKWKDKLLEEMNTTVEHLQSEQMNFADPVDRASQEEGFTLELRTRDREWKLIKRIESCLADLDSGDYGYCEDCGAEIGLRRLEVRPTAVKCIDCKTYQEIREKHEGSA